MDEIKITNLAQEYANGLHPDIAGNDDYWAQLERLFIEEEADEAASFMRFLLRAHCVVPTDEVRAHYTDAYLTAGLSRTREERLVAEAVVKVLESIFGAETFENLGEVEDKDKCLPDDADRSEKKENRCEKCGVPNSSICAHMNCQDYPSQSEPKPAEPKFKIGDKVKHSAHPHDMASIE